MNIMVLSINNKKKVELKIKKEKKIESTNTSFIHLILNKIRSNVNTV